MGWSATVDAYCERLGPGFWAEPLNAVTNAAFVIAAVAAWCVSAGVPVARLLSAVLFAIGVGSFLFHTLATRWAALADVLPIALFILTYVWAANRHFLGFSVVWSTLATVLYIPLHAALALPLSKLPIAGVSASYLPVPIAIIAYASVLWRHIPSVARGMAVGAESSASRSFSALWTPRYALTFAWARILCGTSLMRSCFGG